MITYLKNTNILDIKDIDNIIICHQVNCLGIMGGGLALQIKNKYPKVFESYKKDCDVKQRHENLGHSHIVDVNDNNILAVANLFGQEYIGSYQRQTNYEHLYTALLSLKIKANVEYKNKCNIVIPYKLGCGLAGGDWDIVLAIIETVFEDTHVYIAEL